MTPTLYNISTKSVSEQLINYFTRVIAPVVESNTTV